MATSTTKEIYSKNYLSGVILLLNFESLTDLSLKRVNTLFNDIDLELSQPEVIDSFSLNVRSDQEGVSADRSEIKNYRLNYKDSISVTLSNESLSFEVKNYASFEDFKQVYSPIIESFIKLFDVQTFNRVGLRYVNEIKLDGSDVFNWDGYLKPHFLEPMKSMSNVDSYQLLRTMQNIIVAINSDTLISINHGLFNNNYPASPVQKTYIIDLDCFNAYGTSSKEYIDLLDEYNEEIRKLFESIIDDKLREGMR